jgi:hypothetical protein
MKHLLASIFLIVVANILVVTGLGLYTFGLSQFVEFMKAFRK